MAKQSFALGKKDRQTMGKNPFKEPQTPLQGTSNPPSRDSEHPFRGQGMSLQGRLRQIVGRSMRESAENHFPKRTSAFIHAGAAHFHIQKMGPLPFAVADMEDFCYNCEQ